MSRNKNNNRRKPRNGRQKNNPVPTPQKELRASKNVRFQQIVQVVIPAESPPGQYTSLIFQTANGHGSAVFQRAPGVTPTVISRSPSNTAPFLGLGLFPVGSQNSQWLGWQRQFNLFKVNAVHMKASCSYSGSVGGLTSQYIARDETGILCDVSIPGTGGGQLGPLTYIESLEQMKYLKFSAFPSPVKMGIDYRPILPAINSTEFLQTRNGNASEYQRTYNLSTTPGVIYLQNFTVYQQQSVPIVIATALLHTDVTFLESALTTNSLDNLVMRQLRESQLKRQAILQQAEINGTSPILEDLQVFEKEDPAYEIAVVEESSSNTNFDSLTRSQLVQFIDTLDHKPSHMKGRIGEADNPGPVEPL